MGLKRIAKKNEEVLIVFAILIAVMIVGGFASNRFFIPMNLGNILEQATALGIVAIGQTLVVLLGGIDLSTGAVVSMATTVMSYPLSDDPAGIVFNILIVIGIGAAVGLFNGIGVTKLKLPPFIMTLSTMCIVAGIALKVRPIPGGSVPMEFLDLLNGRMGVVPRATILWIAIAAVIFCVLKYRRFGRDLYAVGGNAQTAALSGISVVKTNIKAYMLCSVLAAVGGIYLASRMGTGDATLGSMYGMDSITVCVLGGVSLFGGRGNIVGVFAATFILCMLSNILNLVGVASYYQYLLKGIILLATVTVFSLKDLRNRERTF